MNSHSFFNKDYIDDYGIDNNSKKPSRKKKRKKSPVQIKVAENTYVENFIQSLEPGIPNVSFPAYEDTISLTADQYHAYLEKLTERLQKEKNTLNRLSISADCAESSVALINGIAKFYESDDAYLPVINLTLYLNAFNLDAFISLLQNTRAKKLPEFQLVTKTVTEEEIKSLVEEIIKCETLAVFFTLPEEFKKSNYQKILDENYYHKIQIINSHDLGKQPVINLKKDTLKPKITHSRLIKVTDVTTDIEVQNEQQAEIAVEFANQIENQQEDFAEINPEHLMDKEAFKIWALKNRYRNRGLTGNIEEDAYELWNNWEGLASGKEDSKLKMTSIAALELLIHRNKFRYGIDFDNLPAGFRLITKSGGYKELDFRASHKRLAKYNPLKIQCEILPQAIPISNEYLKKWYRSKKKSETDKKFAKRWKQMNAEKYDRTEHQNFRNQLLKVSNFDFLTCINNIDTQQALAEIIKIIPEIKRVALLQIYDKYGHTGIVSILHLIKRDPVLFEQLYTDLFINMESLSPLLTVQYQDAMQAISGFSDKQRAWWNVLFKQHCAAQKVDNLAHLVNAFKEFSRQLAAFGFAYNFDKKCMFKKVKSLPVLLSRVITWLHKCKADNRLKQWQSISKLDFSSVAVTKAINENGIDGKEHAFFHEQQKITLRHIDKITYRYSKNTSWKTIHVLNEYKEYRKRFFRYVGCQPENGNLLMEFYDKADKLLQNSGLSQKLLSKLYALIADATTRSATVATIKNTQIALADLENIITIFSEIPLPSVVKSFVTEDIKESIRLEVVNLLYNFDSIPPLPVLGKLITFIAKSIDNVFDLVANAKKLTEACAGLNAMAREYGPSIYEGMKNYSDTDFDDKELFYRYLDLVKLTKKIFGPDKFFAIFFIKLTSTFRLDKSLQEYEQLIESIKTFSFNENIQVMKGLEILADLSIKNNKAFSIQDLKSVITTIRENDLQSHDAVFDLISKHYIAKYFPEDYFLMQQNDSLPKDIEAEINAYFSKERASDVKFILKNFTDRQDKSCYHQVIDTLFIISDKLNSDEQRLFFAKLKDLNLYQDIRITTYLNLLNQIALTKSVDIFIYFMEQCKAYAMHTQKPVQAICQKASLYLEKLLPLLNKIENKQLHNLEFQTFSIDILLNTDIKELGLSSSLEFGDSKQDKSYENVLDSLVSELEDKKQIENVYVKASVVERFVVANENICEAAGIIFDATLKVKERIEKSNQHSIMSSGVIFDDDNELKEFSSDVIKAKDEFNQFIEYRKTYANVYANLIANINETCAKNAIAKKAFIEMCNKHISHYNYSKNDPSLLSYLHLFISQLDNLFSKIQDKNIVLALCVQFNGEKDKQGNLLQPYDLLKLLAKINSFQNDVVMQLLLIKIATSLIGVKSYSYTDFVRLIDTLQQDDKHLFRDFITYVYKERKPPYPDLDTVHTWYQEGIEIKCNLDQNAYLLEQQAATIKLDLKEKKRVNKYGLKAFVESLNKRFEAFDLNPYPYLKSEKNGFYLNAALKILKNYPDSGLSESNLSLLKRECSSAEKQSTIDLLNNVNNFKNISIEKALATLAVLLQRSTTMELNTTQYMIILSMLKSGMRSTTKIYTGEGKSRISMVCVAYENLLGKTVDVNTADIHLATRDYIKFQLFFYLLSIKTTMIYDLSPLDTYIINGINVSDVSNMALFRNVAATLGKNHLVRPRDPNDWALFLDEADKAFYDMFDTRFNYSVASDNSIKGMEWVYPLLVDYFADNEVTNNNRPMDLFYDDFAECRESFISYAISKCTDDQIVRIRTLTTEQLNQWLESAVEALRFEYNVQFKIKPNTLISTPQGPKLSSEAKVLDDGLIRENSRFSFGIQQCLQARCNKDKRKIACQIYDGFSEEYIKAIQACDYPFFISAEKQIVYSSTIKNYLDSYQGATFRAISGTTGSRCECKEQILLNDNTFFNAPRHNPLKRLPTVIHIVNSEEERYQTLRVLTDVASKKSQPILYICKDDNQSASLHNRLGTDNYKDVEYIGSEDSVDEVARKISLAGYRSHKTIGTGRLGRGTDIEIEAEVKKYGLNTIIPFLPTSRDLDQDVGRSGRLGENGEAHVIITRDELRAYCDLNAFKNEEEAIHYVQYRMDTEKQIKRLIKNTVGDFRYYLTNQFYNNHDQISANKLKPKWTKLFSDSDKVLSQYKNAITHELSKGECTSETMYLIQDILDNYQEHIHTLWDVFHKECKHEGMRLVKKLPRIDLTDEIYNVLGLVKINNIVRTYSRELRTKIKPSDAALLNLNVKYSPQLTITPELKDNEIVYVYTLDCTIESKLTTVFKSLNISTQLEHDGKIEFIDSQLLDIDKILESNISAEDRADLYVNYFQRSRLPLPLSVEFTRTNVDSNKISFNIMHSFNDMTSKCEVQLDKDIFFRNQYSLIDAEVLRQLNEDKHANRKLVDAISLKMRPVTERINLFIDENYSSFLAAFSELHKMFDAANGKNNLLLELKKCHSENAVYSISKKYIDNKLDKREGVYDQTITSLIKHGLIHRDYVYSIDDDSDTYYKTLNPNIDLEVVDSEEEIVTAPEVLSDDKLSHSNTPSPSSSSRNRSPQLTQKSISTSSSGEEPEKNRAFIINTRPLKFIDNDDKNTFMKPWMWGALIGFGFGLAALVFLTIIILASHGTLILPGLMLASSYIGIGLAKILTLASVSAATATAVSTYVSFGVIIASIAALPTFLGGLIGHYSCQPKNPTLDDTGDSSSNEISIDELDSGEDNDNSFQPIVPFTPKHSSLQNNSLNTHKISDSELDTIFICIEKNVEYFDKFYPELMATFASLESDGVHPLQGRGVRAKRILSEDIKLSKEILNIKNEHIDAWYSENIINRQYPYREFI